MITAAKEFVDKKLIKLSDRNQVTIKIWFLENPELHYFLEKAFWRFDEHLKEMDGLFLDLGSNDIDFTIIAEKEIKIKEFTLTNPDGKTKQVKFKFLNEKQLATAAKKKNYYALYNPLGLIKEGGEDE